MRPSAVLTAYREEIRHMIEAHGASNPRVFGSVVHGCDIDGSDLDLLIDPGAHMTLLDLGGLKEELDCMLGITVDLRTPHDLPEKFRDQVLREAVKI